MNGTEELIEVVDVCGGGCSQRLKTKMTQEQYEEYKTCRGELVCSACALELYKLKPTTRKALRENPSMIIMSIEGGMKNHIGEVPANYHSYLASLWWKEQRDKALEYAGYRCQLCNSPDELNVHHRTYERLGCELPQDLTVLCKTCHYWFHKSRHKF